MARVTGNSVAQLDTRTVTIQSNATGTFAHSLAATPDLVIPTVQGDPATAASSSAVPLLAHTEDATNVSVKNYGGDSCSAKVVSQIVHSMIG